MKNIKSPPLALLASTIALGINQAPSAVAQESVGLEEVIVTARRREESLQDVPVAVSAFSRDDLDNQGVLNIAELAQQVPSTTLEASRATNSTLTAYIRGVGQQDPLAGFEQGVALYIDDVYLARPQAALLDVYDIERIEVLRGPQGTLYGRNSVGGTIKYVTRKLGDEPRLSLRTNFGTQNQMDVIATGSTPVTDTLRVGATVASFQRDGFGRNLTTGQDQYDKDLTALRLSAEFRPSDTLEVRLAYDRSDDESSSLSGYRPYAGVTRGEPPLGNVFDSRAGAATQPSTAGINGVNQVEAEGGHVSIDWDPTSSLRLKSITAYREDDTTGIIDFDGLEVMDFDSQGVYENSQFSQEFQLQYSSDQWHAVAGLYYLDAEAANYFDVILAQLVPELGFTGLTDGSVDTKAWSLFTDVTYDVNEKWSVSAGVRYTEDQRNADVFRADYLGIGSPAFGNQQALLFRVNSDYDAERTFYNASPRFNVRYNLSDDAHLYGGYSQGWKAGSFDPRGANFLTPTVEQGFDDETLDSFELGLKSQWLDGRAVLNLALFYSEYQDMQIPGSAAIDVNGDGVNDGFVGAVTNAGEATIAGLEIEGAYRFSERLSLQFAYSGLDPEIDEWIVGGVDISGQTNIQNTPERQAFLGLNYTMPLFGGDLLLNGNWSYRSKTYQFEIPAPDLDQPSYDLFNASAVWTSQNENWMLGVHGKNLGDEEIRTAGYCFGASGGCPASLGLEDNVTVFFAPPRTVTATVEYRF